MGVIQDSINQTIGNVALLSGLVAHSPAAKDLAEGRKLKGQEKAINQRVEALTERANAEAVNNQPLSSAEQSILEDAGKQLTDVHKQMFERDPSPKTLNKYEQTKKAADMYQQMQEEIKAKAQASMEARQRTLEKRATIRAEILRR